MEHNGHDRTGDTGDERTEGRRSDEVAPPADAGQTSANAGKRPEHQEEKARTR